MNRDLCPLRGQPGFHKSNETTAFTENRMHLDRAQVIYSDSRNELPDSTSPIVWNQPDQDLPRNVPKAES